MIRLISRLGTTKHINRKFGREINQKVFVLETNKQETVISVRGIQNTKNMSSKDTKVEIDQEELKKRLTPLQYKVTQEKGTEAPFSGEYENNKEKGIYKCVVCGNKLFKSKHKFDSGSGWPSFYQSIDKNAVTENVDESHGMRRVEVVCEKCKAHLGHVFPDGPSDKGGQRFCMNSASLDFQKK